MRGSKEVIGQLDKLAVEAAVEINNKRFSELLFKGLYEARSKIINSPDDEIENNLYVATFQINKVSSILEKENKIKKKGELVSQKINTLLDQLAKQVVESEAQQNILFEKLKNARRKIIASSEDKEIAIEDAEFIAKTVETILEKNKQQKKEDSVLRWAVHALILIYISMILLAIFGLNHEKWTTTTNLPLIGIPVSVVLWAAFGSLAAILYRFYTKEFKRISAEIKWLTARPVIGVIMGSLMYLSLKSGTIIFGAESSDESKMYIYWIVAFLGGFSDKFFESIIDSLTGKITSGNYPEKTQPPSNIN
ncbi:MAG: hypothetical protein D3917_13490 [Candidatus Electrothrix sp. AX5]|nr:hypothetical protein [Candidatus Electrothrix sp. AX5]